MRLPALDFPTLRAWQMQRLVREQQPEMAKSRVVVTRLGAGSIDAFGKVSPRRFLPTFLSRLRQLGHETDWAFSVEQLSRHMSKPDIPVVIIHLFGEDNEDISSTELDTLEAQAAATFNGSRIGPLLADKLKSHEVYARNGIDTPALTPGEGFVRNRRGSGMPTKLDVGASIAHDPERDLRTEFNDTCVAFRGQSYHTTVRLHCLDGDILHAYARARDVRDADASVHARNTPLDPHLIEHLHRELVTPRIEAFHELAGHLTTVLGHGFFVHDLLIESETGRIAVCESGLKFDDRSWWGHIEPIAAQLPSQSILFPIEDFARHSADVFSARCDDILGLESGPTGK